MVDLPQGRAGLAPLPIVVMPYPRRRGVFDGLAVAEMAMWNGRSRRGR